jgi:hypothetical protein
MTMERVRKATMKPACGVGGWVGGGGGGGLSAGMKPELAQCLLRMAYYVLTSTPMLTQNDERSDPVARRSRFLSTCSPVCRPGPASSLTLKVRP